jgi:hypothetical protein
MPGGSVYKDKVHEHNKTQETENTERTQKIHKHIHEKNIVFIVQAY